MKTRASNIELFRILCMLGIILSHFLNSNGIEEYSTINKIVHLYGTWGGYIGNIGYMTISAYFLVDAERTKWTSYKVVRIFFKGTIYSILLWLIGSCVFGYTLNIEDAIVSILPFIYGSYGYLTAYICIAFIYPYLNFFYEKLGKDMMRKYLFILTGFMVVPILFCGANIRDAIVVKGYLFPFIYIYTLVFYLKRYTDNVIDDKKKMFCFSCLGLILTMGFSVMCLVMRRWLPVLGEFTSDWAMTGSITQIMFVVCAFFLVVSIDIGYSRWINWLASSTIGVFILHNNSIMKKYEWVATLEMDTWGTDSTFIVKVAIVVLGTFLFWTIVEKALNIISGIFKKQYDFLMKQITYNIDNLIKPY